MKKIAVCYDPLYNRHYGKNHRTGIYRYSHNLIQGLIKADSIHLSLVRQGAPLYDTYDLYHSLFHYRAPKSVKRTSAKSVVTIHDLIAWLYPEFFQLQSEDFLLIKKLQKERFAIVPSQATKRDLIEHFSMDSARIFVTPVAACPDKFYPTKETAPLEKYGIPKDPYFFFMGRLEERKGITWLLRAFKELLLQEKIEDLNLVLSGPIAPAYQELFHVFHHEIKNSSIASRIIHIPFIADEDLPALYSNALAFTFLTHYEGFGLPPLEAMHCGTPTLCFNNSSLPEVVGDCGLLLKEKKIESIAEALFRFYNEPSWVRVLGEMGIKRAQTFTWEKTIQKTLLAYKSILNDEAAIE